MFGDPAPLRALLDDFERAEGLTVVNETLPSGSDEQHQFYAINLQARSTAFDVFAADVIWVAGFARAGWLRPLDDLLPADARAGFFAAPIDAVTWRGSPYAVPWYVDAGLLYYRSDLLERHGLEVPATWGELVSAAQTITSREPDLFGHVWQGRQYEGLVCNALEFIWSNGGDVFDNERFRFDSAANREALTFMADLVHRHAVTPASVSTATEEPCRHLFGQGRAVFMRNWPYAWALFADPASRVNGRVGVTVLPHFPGGSSAATLGGWQLAVNAHSLRPDAAARLVAFLTSEAAQRRLALDYGFQPSRLAPYRDGALRARLPILDTLADVFAGARPRPVTPQYVRVSLAMQSAFSAVLTARATAADALAALDTSAARIMADAR
jgi:multiple sugar transport system substrate-binding protein